MFQDRLRNTLPSTFKPSKDRDIDAVLLGAISNRRRSFHDEYIEDYHETNDTIQHDYNNTLSSRNIVYRNQLTEVTKEYGNAKICMIIHNHLTDGACEYHRLSEISCFGCMLVVENVGDMTVDIFQQCGGVHFAAYHDVAKTIHEQLAYIEETPATVLKARQEKYERWWANGIEWDTLLESILGPREYSSEG